MDWHGLVSITQAQAKERGRADVHRNFYAQVKLNSYFLYNPHILNIDALSGALFTLRTQYNQTQYDEGARDGLDIWYLGIMLSGF